MLTLSQIKRVGQFNEFFYGRSDAVHRFGLGMCDPSGEPLDIPALQIPVIDGRINSYTKLKTYEVVGAKFCAAMLHVGNHYVHVPDVPRDELADLVGKGLSLYHIARDQIDPRIVHASFENVNRNLSIILGSYTLDLRTGEILDK